MIINFFVDLFVTLVSFILQFIHIPSLPFDVSEAENFFVEVTDYGYPIFSFFMPGSVVNIAIEYVIFLETFMFGYKIVVWLYQKIPGAGK